ncbi:MAG: TetR/AcrR family transcriptional regulator [Erysipelotrichia bacterium]|nr:TetR/AcrR family transcriptional regulator [Erysipelotrichia bacterium]
MNENINVKDKIIKTTIDLIEKSNGFVENITIRKIAEISNVSVGLINYHFGSKEKLIEICVQKIISNVMSVFPNIEGSNEYLKNANKDIANFSINVFKFLLNNPEISKISMLSDLSTPSIDSNSSISYRAIYKALNDVDSNKTKKIKAFIFLSTLQSAFLNKDISNDLLGINFNNEEDYNFFFMNVAKLLNI